MLERTDVLDRVKALSLLPDGMHVTTAMVAAYFEVAETVVNNLLSRHRQELESNGLRVLRGADLREFQNLKVSSSSSSTWSTWPAHSLWKTRRRLTSPPSMTASTNASPTSSASPPSPCSTP
ncbi:hypothetical protein [Streptomyces sp. AC550_RSS872]|uniref:hypothetical protein n=1 Tax=Streptomyces sp. AC550_RSS872 TaxID=2823689 RepID=UPI0027E51D9E|nr:hypothetical protein [Streptomyces sp. AC550_RSS872]